MSYVHLLTIYKLAQIALPPPYPSPPPPETLSPSLTPAPAPPPFPCFDKVGTNFMKCQYSCMTYVSPISYYTELFLEDAMRSCAQRSECVGIEQAGCKAAGHYYLCSSLRSSSGCAILKIEQDNSVPYILTRSSLIVVSLSSLALFINFFLRRYKRQTKSSNIF